MIVTAQLDTNKMEQLFSPIGIGDSIKGRVLGKAPFLHLGGPNLNLYKEEKCFFSVARLVRAYLNPSLSFSLSTVERLSYPFLVGKKHPRNLRMLRELRKIGIE